VVLSKAQGQFCLYYIIFKRLYTLQVEVGRVNSGETGITTVHSVCHWTYYWTFY